MPNVLTTQSTVACGHGGTAAVVSSAKLAVNGMPVLLEAGVAGATIGACGTTPAADASGPTAAPCSAVSTVDSGRAAKLTVDGAPVLLDSLTGSTNGMVAKLTPQTLLTATAGQQKLSAGEGGP